MIILNITHAGQSTDHEVELDAAPSDLDVRRIALEIARAAGAVLADGAFDDYVVDHVDNVGQLRLYLRPKVPFGSAPTAKRFMVFGFDQYYPNGGMDDCRGIFVTIEEARENCFDDYYQIVDITKLGTDENPIVEGRGAS